MDFNKLSLFIWNLLPGKAQWSVLWLMHAKFVVGVCGVIFDDEDKVLLIKHKYRRKDSVWGLPSGHANRGEALEHILVREVFEETGYNIAVNSLLKVESGLNSRIELVYVGKFIGGNLKIDPIEVSEVSFFNVDSLPKEIIDAHRLLIENTHGMKNIGS